MNALEIKQLRKIYANGIEAVKGIDLNVQQGDFFALLGVNGAGKSTTIGLITTLLTKTSGSICINGYDLDRERTQAKSCLGLVPQEVNLNVFETCEQILINQAGYYGIPRKRATEEAQVLLTQLGLIDKRNHIIRHLSGGMKRRLMIARALIHKPDLLLLDEPTAGVDIEIRHDMWNFLSTINKAGTTIILTTHYLEEAEQLCKHIAIIDKGLIVEQSSMKALLQGLEQQSFIFNTVEAITTLPALDPFITIPIDSHTFELRINGETSLNDVFARLSQEKLHIHSLRNKTNRLEELFMNRIKHEK